MKGTPKILFLTIYRPPRYSANFIDDFAELLSIILVDAKLFIITGDFNIHIDNSTDNNAKELFALLDTFDLTQHVKERTHTHDLRSGYF